MLSYVMLHISVTLLNECKNVDQTAPLPTDDQLENSKTECSTIMCILEGIKTSIEQLSSKVDDHIQSTCQMFSELRDVLHSVKRQATCNSKKTSDSIESLTVLTQSVQDNADRARSELVKRLQSLSDVVKGITSHQDASKPCTDTLPRVLTQPTVNQQSPSATTCRSATVVPSPKREDYSRTYLKRPLSGERKYDLLRQVVS